MSTHRGLSLRSVERIQWPNIHGASLVSSDNDPLPCSYPSHDVVHPCDEGGFGQTHDCILKVLCFLQSLQKLPTITFNSPQLIPEFEKRIITILTSLRSQLTGDLWNRKADTKFFHQFHQCSVPGEVGGKKRMETAKNSHKCNIFLTAMSYLAGHQTQ